MRTRRDRLTLQAALNLHLEDCLARGLSVRTVESKHYTLTAFVAWCKSKRIVRVSRVTLRTLEDYRKHLHMHRQERNGEPLDLGTQRKALTDVKRLFYRLKRTGLIGKDPSLDFDLPYVPRRPPKDYLVVEEVEAICKQTQLLGLKGSRDRAVLETFYATGVRRMELANLDIRDVNIKEEVVTVRRGKGARDRRIPISRRAIAWVEFYLTRVRPKFANMGSGHALFLDNRGRRYKPRQLTELASQYVKLAGIKKPGASNLFRHTCATLMLENGADIRHVQEMLGHADISSTQVYTHVAIGKLKEVYRRTHPSGMDTQY